jgi:hypothetical protein
MKYQNVYVNVTYQLQKDNEISKCLCKCYVATSKKIMNYQNVHVNLRQKLQKDNEISKCLCECYIATSER